MQTKAKIKDLAEAQVTKRPAVLGGIGFRNTCRVECFDKNGNLKWTEENGNIMTDEGLNHALDVLLHGETQISPWYVAPVETDTSPAAGMTYATPSFTECEAYDEANRVEYVEAAASSKSVTNSENKATFTINATKTIYGAALFGATDSASIGDDKGDVAAGGGVLLCYSKFGSSKAVEDDDTLEVTYTITAADA